MPTATPILTLAGMLALSGAAAAQPLILVSQNRTAIASGQCCDRPSQTESAAETGMNPVFAGRSIAHHFDTVFNHYHGDAQHDSTVSGSGISGYVHVQSWQRGLDFPAYAWADSSCVVTFAIETPCDYTYTATAQSEFASFLHPTSFVLNGPSSRIFQGRVTNEERTFTRSGELAPGQYMFILNCRVDGDNFGRTAACAFNLSVGAPCPCDWTQDALLNSADFFAFLVDFFALDADFNDSGSTDSQDFFDFLGCFFGGCA